MSEKPRAINSAVVDSPDKDKQIVSENKVDKMTDTDYGQSPLPK